MMALVIFLGVIAFLGGGACIVSDFVNEYKFYNGK